MKKLGCRVARLKKVWKQEIVLDFKHGGIAHFQNYVIQTMDVLTLFRHK